MLEFVEHEDGVISIVGGDGECIGNLIYVKGFRRLSLNYLINSGNMLRQIADKLDELNGVSHLINPSELIMDIYKQIKEEHDRFKKNAKETRARMASGVRLPGKKFKL